MEEQYLVHGSASLAIIIARPEGHKLIFIKIVCRVPSAPTSQPAPCSLAPTHRKLGPPLVPVMGLPGKPNGMTGADVEQYYRQARIREIADYCETDVVNTYRVWLRYELFRGHLTDAEF